MQTIGTDQGVNMVQDRGINKVQDRGLNKDTPASYSSKVNDL